MDHGSSFNWNDCPEPIDRSKVLVVRPLKYLVPLFVDESAARAPLGTNPQPTPFTCPRPTGSYPSGVQPFYPFLVPNDAKRGRIIPNHSSQSAYNPCVAPKDAQPAPSTISNQPSGSTSYPRAAQNDARQCLPVIQDLSDGSTSYPCAAQNDAQQGLPVMQDLSDGVQDQPGGSLFYPGVALNAQLGQRVLQDQTGGSAFYPGVALNDVQVGPCVVQDRTGESAFYPGVALNDAQLGPRVVQNQTGGSLFYPDVALNDVQDRPGGSAAYPGIALNDVQLGSRVIHDQPGGSPSYPCPARNDAQRVPFVTTGRLGGSTFYPAIALDNAKQGPRVTPIQPTNFGFGGNIPNHIPSDAFMVSTSQANVGTSGCQGTHKETITVDDDTYDELLRQYVEPESGLGSHGNEVIIARCKSRKRGHPKEEITAKNAKEISVQSMVSNYLAAFKLTDIDEFKRSSNDRELVRTILLVYDLVRRKLFHQSEKNNSGTRRPDLKVGGILMDRGVRANELKKIGHVPGIEVGDIFYFRMEMCIVGLHAPSMGGIDYFSFKTNMEEESLAVSIVSSGGYEDDGDDGNVLIYSGQGGVQRKDGQMFDQKLERGNLALHNSHNHNSDVRVIRGVKDPTCPNAKIYIYDGLYKIEHSWEKKNNFSCTIFQYRLVRIPGQPDAFSTWKSVQQWKDGTIPRPGIIIADLSAGAENQSVAVVNDVDGEMGPAHFTYMCSLKYSKTISTSLSSFSCNCVEGCLPRVRCQCYQKNGGHLPYAQLGTVLTEKPLIHECGVNCRCPLECRNRVSQAGLRVRLEVFKTSNRGWGLRSWDPIRAGSFICEYAGDIIGDFNTNYVWSGDGNDDYIFDTARYYEPHDNFSGVANADFPFVISAKRNGNVARFMNHSCSPAVHWKLILRESTQGPFLYVAFFAIRHIPPLQELTFDYGIVPPEKGYSWRKPCLCGSEKCRGYFY